MNSTPLPSPEHHTGPAPKLKTTLNGWQVLFISLSAVIGTGVFNFDGLAINLAGPIGYLIALLTVAIVAISFLDGLSEMIQIFPCTNALVHFVRFFVDEQLATCVGWAYWAAQSSFINIQITSAAEFTAVWIRQDGREADIGVRIGVFCFACQIILYFINTRQVSFFGWVQVAGGCVKLSFTVSFALCLYYLGGQIEVLNNPSKYSGVVGKSASLPKRDTYLNPPFAVWNGYQAAVCNVFAVTSLVAFSWVGIDTIAVTAFEALPDELRLPPQRIGYTVLIIYIIFGIGSAISVDPLNPTLAQLFTPNEMPPEGNVTVAQSTSVLADSSAIITIAAEQVGNRILGAVSNAFLIFSALSAANTCVYTASRTLYGLAITGQMPFAGKSDGKVGGLREGLLRVSSNDVPRWAVFVSLIAFIWIPFLGLAESPVNSKVPIAAGQFTSLIASTAVVFIWGTQCLAFIRYYYWLRRNRDWGYIDLKKYPHLNRLNPKDWKARTWLQRFQPVPAYIGFVGCIGIVMVFPTAVWWGEPPHNPSGWSFDFFQIYTAPLLILGLWVFLKIRIYRNKNYNELFIKLEADGDRFEQIVGDLNWHAKKHAAGPSPDTELQPVSGCNNCSRRSVS